MAGVVPGIAEPLAAQGQELPVVTAGMKAELQYAEGVGVAHLAVGLGSLEPVVALPAGPDDDLADAASGIGLAPRSLGGEPLVDVSVGRENDIGAVLVEGVPERPHLRGVAVGVIGDESGLVPVGEGALVRVGGQV